jgi:hypothetical protein
MKTMLVMQKVNRGSVYDSSIELELDFTKAKQRKAGPFFTRWLMAD